MKNPQENTIEVRGSSGNEGCGGFSLDTGDGDKLPLPSELRFASPMQISTDLCCWTIGMCSSQGESKDKAVTRRWHFPKGFHAAHHEFLCFRRLKALRIFISTQKSTCQVGRGCLPTTQTGRWARDFNGTAWSASFRSVLPTWRSFPYSKITFAKMIFAWKTTQRMLNKQNKPTTATTKAGI